MAFVHYGTMKVPDIHTKLSKSYINPWLSYNAHWHVFCTTALEAATTVLIANCILNPALSVFMWQDIVFFIPVSFAFELAMDFGHYWTHRTIHTFPLLYVYVHKKHHKYAHPQIIHTYYQSVADVLLTISVPTVAAIYAVNHIYPVTPFMLHTMMVYKAFIEISGHSGKQIKTTSFPQCIWLPQLLNIPLCTVDHDLHHSLNNCNYSKRFSLWDRLFETYVDRS
jgi:sterol desaturase/sphingolipid hydroxylase (fatty acid hydroxylase superfamily)